MKKAPILKRIYYKLLPPEFVEIVWSTLNLQWGESYAWGQFLNVPMKGRRALVRVSGVYPPKFEYEFYYYL